MDEGEAYVSQWKTEFDDTSDKKNMQVVGGGGFSIGLTLLISE